MFQMFLRLLNFFLMDEISLSFERVNDLIIKVISELSEEMISIMMRSSEKGTLLTFCKFYFTLYSTIPCGSKTSPPTTYSNVMSARLRALKSSLNYHTHIFARRCLSGHLIAR